MRRRKANNATTIWKSGRLISLFLVLLLASCRHADIIWTGSYNFPAGKWDPDNKVALTPDTVFLQALAERDSSATADALLTLRYGQDAFPEKIRIVVETENPAVAQYTCDTLAFRLLPLAARTADKGRIGVFETTDTLLRGVHPRPGWNVTLHPIDDGNEITNIYSLTLELK